MQARYQRAVRFRIVPRQSIHMVRPVILSATEIGWISVSEAHQPPVAVFTASKWPLSSLSAACEAVLID